LGARQKARGSFYGASKTLAERAAYDFVAKEMPSDVAESQWFDAVSVYQCHTKHQHFGDGLYYTTHCNPFMVILGMLYFWVKKSLPHYASRWPCQ
jgi:hypothetical protein